MIDLRPENLQALARMVAGPFGPLLELVARAVSPTAADRMHTWREACAGSEPSDGEALAAGQTIVAEMGSAVYAAITEAFEGLLRNLAPKPEAATVQAHEQAAAVETDDDESRLN